MSRRAAATVVSTKMARTRLCTMLKQVSEKRARFVITEAGKPLAVLLSVSDLDDMLEELDPGFQRSLRSAEQEYRAGRSVALRGYAKGGFARRRVG